MSEVLAELEVSEFESLVGKRTELKKIVLGMLRYPMEFYDNEDLAEIETTDDY